MIEEKVILQDTNSSQISPAQQETADAVLLAHELRNQLQMAGRVQRDFLPQTLPNTPQTHWAAMFEPAEWVSGDIYDVARLDERHIGFYIADVVGHSIPAALLTIFVKQAIVMRRTRGSKYSIFEPAEVMNGLNRSMTDQKLSGCQFATCCYCLLNIETMKLTFARAGHPYPIIIRPGRHPAQIESEGPLLGIFKNAEFEQQTIQLRSGDKILLYSDGLESVIGRFRDSKVFSFNDDFVRACGFSIERLISSLQETARQNNYEPQDKDDRTAAGLEII